MRKRRLLLPLAALAGALLMVVPGAIAGGGGGGTLESPTGAWFIQLSGSADTFAAKAKAARLEYTERYRFNDLWKGVSVEASPETVQDLKTLAGVEAVFPVLEARLDPTETVSPELATAINMTGANEAQSELGLTGKGVKVAVMDTGVDYDNPDLGGCFGAGCRVATGIDLVGDRFDASSSGGALRPHPDADPDDCNGHGTHVAGIIGAKAAGPGGVTGVAPGVTFGVYRVFGCEGSTTADIMLAAMERIAADDMDVLNMSIGSAFQTWPQYPTAVGADKLVSEHGVVVVASIGNSGANGVYSAGAPGVGRNVIGVASIDNTHVNALTFRTSRTNRQVPYMQIADTKEAPTSGSTPELVHVGRGCSTTAPPDPYLANPAGKVALIDRGTCTFNEKYQRAIKAGAVAVVVANNVPGLFAGGGVIDRGFPAVGISKEDGDAIKAELAGGAVTLTWTGDRINAVNPTGGLASSFTSYGLTAELDLKPDIAAPGGLIFSTYPLEKGGHTVLSGTSMASPHVAGAVALFLEARPGTTPAMVRQILQNSADPIPLAPGIPQAVHRVGAGMLDIDDAIESTTSIAPGKVVLGEGSTAKTVQLTIANNGPAAVTYSLGHEPAAGTRGSTFAPILTTNFASASFSPSSVLVAAGGSATVDVTITPNTANPNFDRSVYGGYIRITGGGQTFRVPYAGFTGDYQSIQVLAPGGCSFPGVFKRGGSTECVAAQPGPPPVAAQMLEGFTRQAAGATYNVEQREDRPVILFHLAHQSRRLEIRAVNASGQEFLVARSDFVIRNPTNDRASTGFFTFTWDGKAVFTNAKNGVSNRRALDSGQYKLKVVVTKAQQVGDASPETLEVWDSPTLNIVRIS